MPLPYSAEELTSALLDVIRENNMRACYVRPIVLRGYGACQYCRRTIRSIPTLRVFCGAAIWVKPR